MIDFQIDDRTEHFESFTELIKKACVAVLIAENYVESVEISIILTGNDDIRELNNQYRNKNSSTDVLSFPMNEVNPDNGFTVLGDIVINTEKAEEQAREFGHGLEREIAFLVIHSMLHLLGYDHENDDAGERIMREKQTSILETLKLGF